MTALEATQVAVEFLRTSGVPHGSWRYSLFQWDYRGGYDLYWNGDNPLRWRLAGYGLQQFSNWVDPFELIEGWRVVFNPQHAEPQSMLELLFVWVDERDPQLRAWYQGREFR